MSTPETPADTSTDAPVALPVALRVVHGRPSAEDVAAVAAVLLTRGGDEGEAAAPSRWATPRLRGQHHASRGGWQASALPR